MADLRTRIARDVFDSKTVEKAVNRMIDYLIDNEMLSWKLMEEIKDDVMNNDDVLERAGGSNQPLSRRWAYLADNGLLGQSEAHEALTQAYIDVKCKVCNLVHIRETDDG